jgi:tight adherence protein B
MNAWMPAILAFVAVSFGVITLALLTEGIRTMKRRSDMQKRLGKAIENLTEQSMVERSLLDPAEARAREMQELVARMPFIAPTSSLLMQSGLNWSPGTFLLLIIGFAIAGGVLGMAAGLPLLLALLAAFIAAYLPYIFVRRRRTVRHRKFEELLPEAIDYLSRAIRAGHPLSAGIQMVSEELAEPLGGEFRKMFDQQRFGVPFEEALLAMCDRIELVDIRIFATSIIVQREVGGASFGEVLDNMAQTIRTRFAIRREINVYTAQGRMSGMVVGLMPFVVAVAIYLQDPNYVRMLFQHPIGRMMAVSGVVLQVIGFFWIRKIVNVEI